MVENHIGKPQNRYDGKAKVTGAAKYAAEHAAPDLAYGVVVSSAIARGKIKSIDVEEAMSVPGMVSVLTHENRPSTAWFNKKYKDEDSPAGEHFRPLRNEEILFSGQPIALVVAENFEAARRAAALVKVEYEVAPHQTSLRGGVDEIFRPKKSKPGYEKPPSPRGNSAKAYEAAPFKAKAKRKDAVEHHNPMEMHASTVIYDAGKLLIYDKTQGVANSQTYVCKVFGLNADDVTVRAPYVGGAFGSALRPQYQLFLATAAALELKRSVRVVLTRQQMFTFGHRPGALHEIRVAADKDGRLMAVEHRAATETSRFENYTDIVVNWSGNMYQCDNVTLDHKLIPLDLYTPLDMRAPGAATGVPSFETVIDDLAYAAGIDPLDFRLMNYAERDQNHNRPFSSRELRACFTQGAEKFGWSKRPLAPRSMKEGKKLVGWGMATGVWDAMQQKAGAEAELKVDGTLTVRSAFTDIGTGTYTVINQVAADAFSLRPDQVTVELADTKFPAAPLQGGSWTAASISPAVQAACEKVRDQLFKLAQELPQFKKAKAKELLLENGHITWTKDPVHRMRISEVMQLANKDKLTEQATTMPNYVKQLPYTRNTHSAIFVEVTVDEDFGMVEVSRVVIAVAAGKIINPKTARSQVLGGVVWGISQALHEESMLDHKLGRFMNHNYAEYHIPVNKDIHDIDVIFVPEEDHIVSTTGVKGLGEIGIVGVAGAVANAIFHATGKRIAEFPITVDKLIS
jgi:xanthine dehydrogenase YagR molybdenum-binding subunit